MQFRYGNSIPNPCRRDCPERKAGCAINCKAWGEYIQKRDKMYADKLKERGVVAPTKGAMKAHKEFIKNHNKK